MTSIYSRHRLPIFTADRIVTMGVQAIVTDIMQRVLLVRHSYRPGWHFPGGGVERHETVRDAVIRELREETGVITLSDPDIFSIYAHFDAFPGDHIVLMRILQWHQSFIPPPNKEIAEQGFFALDELPEGTTAHTRDRVREVFEGSTISHTW